MKPLDDPSHNAPSGEPRWVGPLALLAGFAAYMIIFGILGGNIPDPLAKNGEGLLISLIFYLPIRVAFRMSLFKKSGRRGRRKKTHEL